MYVRMSSRLWILIGCFTCQSQLGCSHTVWKEPIVFGYRQDNTIRPRFLLFDSKLYSIHFFFFINFNENIVHWYTWLENKTKSKVNKWVSINELENFPQNPPNFYCSYIMLTFFHNNNLKKKWKAKILVYLQFTKRCFSLQQIRFKNLIETIVFIVTKKKTKKKRINMNNENINIIQNI